MLVLPIRQRTGAAGDKVSEPAAAHHAGRQVFLEALAGPWSPAPEPGGSDESSAELRVTVKNTFIDVEGPQEDHSSIHNSGAQTCSARLSDPTPSGIFPEDLADVEEEAYNAPGACTPSSDGSRAAEIAAPPLLAAQPAAGHAAEVSGGRPASPMPAVPPPAFPAPLAFEEEETAPPPQGTPGAAFGRQVLLAALCGMSPAAGAAGAEAADALAAAPAAAAPLQPAPAPQQPAPQMVVVQQVVQPMMAQPTVQTVGQPSGQTLGRPMGGQPFGQAMGQPAGQAMGQHMVVMGPMIQVTTAPALRPSTGPVSPLGLPLAAGTMPTAVAVSAAAATAPAAAEGSAPSVGSAQHGKVLSDGQPACQPCAWFYKASGCTNGANCNRCHLCPEGELKLRKKQKLARLRSAEAAAAAAGAPSSPASSVSPATGRSGEAGDKSQVPSPRWADMDLDSEDDEVQPRPRACTAPVQVVSRGRNGSHLQVPSAALVRAPRR